MDAARFDAALLSALGGITSLSETHRRYAAMAAASAYSRYQPLRRRFGDAALAASAASGDTVIYLAGGLPRPDAVLILDPDGWGSGADAERTVSDVAVANSATSGVEQVAAGVLAVTLSSALTASYPAGTLVSPKPDSDGNRGLSLVADRDTYRLPLDWRSVDQGSFDLAIGARATVRRSGGYYDAIYQQAQRMASAGWGQRANYGSGWPVSGYPIVGDPFNNPNGAPGGASSISCEVVYRFLEGDAAAPRLTILPAPASAQVLDFWYYGCHTLASIPDADADAVCAYARYWALMARATSLGDDADGKVFGIEGKSSDNAEALTEMAQVALKEFEDRLKFRPFGTSG